MKPFTKGRLQVNERMHRRRIRRIKTILKNTSKIIIKLSKQKMQIYNPEDIHHNKYFIIIGSLICHNDLCTLSLNNYEFMCELNGTNPIYPGRKPTPPRPTKNNKGSSYLKDNIYEKIRKRREELGEGEYRK